MCDVPEASSRGRRMQDVSQSGSQAVRPRGLGARSGSQGLARPQSRVRAHCRHADTPPRRSPLVRTPTRARYVRESSSRLSRLTTSRPNYVSECAAQCSKVRRGSAGAAVPRLACSSIPAAGSVRHDTLRATLHGQLGAALTPGRPGWKHLVLPGSEHACRSWSCSRRGAREAPCWRGCGGRSRAGGWRTSATARASSQAWRCPPASGRGETNDAATAICGPPARAMGRVMIERGASIADVHRQDKTERSVRRAGFTGRGRPDKVPPLFRLLSEFRDGVGFSKGSPGFPWDLGRFESLRDLSPALRGLEFRPNLTWHLARTA